MKQILLCSDLDRTLIPNGIQEESPHARKLFSRLASLPSVRLTYVSGRDKDLVKEAIEEFDLPEPDFVIGDVGTTLYHVEKGDWRINAQWQKEIGRDWGGFKHDDITGLLAGMEVENFRLQPDEKQNKYKISYFTNPSIDPEPLKDEVSGILNDKGISANLIWSRDEEARRGLLDILPRSANKLRAIRFLIKMERENEDFTLFAGDSGNDLDVLASGLKAILVKNAGKDVRRAAIDRLSEMGKVDRLYLAKGGFLNMNGNYAAGVLEGAAYFIPEIGMFLQSQVNVI